MRDIHVRVSDEASDGWRRFCARYDVSLAAAVESVGLWLADSGNPHDVGIIDRLGTAAQRIYATRSRREPPRRR